MSVRKIVGQDEIGVTVFGELFTAGLKPEVRANRDFYTLLVQHPDLFRSTVELVETITSISVPRPVFHVRVNRNLALDDALSEAGIPSHTFPLQQISDREKAILGSGTEDVQVEVFRFWRNENRRQIITKLASIGYQPIDVAILLALQAQAPRAFVPGTGIAELSQEYSGFVIATDVPSPIRGDGQKIYYHRLISPFGGSIPSHYRIGAIKTNP